MPDSRDDMLRAHAVERDRKFDGKKGIIGHSIAEVPEGLYVILPPLPARILTFYLLLFARLKLRERKTDRPIRRIFGGLPRVWSSAACGGCGVR